MEAVARHLKDGASLLQQRQRAAVVTLSHEDSGYVANVDTETLAPLAVDFLYASAAVGCVQHSEGGEPL